MKKSILTLCPTLYIVPTPIGNLKDITYRALLILKKVNFIITENVQRTKILLSYFAINKPVHSMNRYNEITKTSMLLSKLQSGCIMALVSDAGTPLINDPGYRLVSSCHKKKIKVVPLPGPCAAVTALCGSGLPANRFCFEGFFPSKKNLRINRLKSLSEESRTLIFYDVKYRIIDSLKDIIYVFGSDRYVVLVRELSKIWESIYGAPVGQLLSWLQQDNTRIKGEIVLVISGYCSKNGYVSDKALYVMRLLASELPVKKAAILAGNICGVKKNILYQTYLREKLDFKYSK